MRPLKKFKTAFYILKTNGAKGIHTTIKSKLVRPRPDETQIAFQVLSSTVRRGMMIDVGAHHGSSLAPFAKSGWDVLAFEPDSKNRSILAKTYGKFSNIQIDPRALSDHADQEVPFYTSDESTGVSGLAAFLPSHQISETVSITTLTHALDEYHLLDHTIDFLKIDTEGFDLLVLKGYPWDQNQPKMILCEFEDGKTQTLGYTFEDIAIFLLDLGYMLIISEWYPVKAYGGLHDWRRYATYPCALQDPLAWGNIFAVREKSLFEHLLIICHLL